MKINSFYVKVCLASLAVWRIMTFYDIYLFLLSSVCSYLHLAIYFANTGKLQDCQTTDELYR